MARPGELTHTPRYVSRTPEKYREPSREPPSSSTHKELGASSASQHAGNFSNYLNSPPSSPPPRCARWIRPVQEPPPGNSPNCEPGGVFGTNEWSLRSLSPSRHHFFSLLLPGAPSPSSSSFFPNNCEVRAQRAHAVPSQSRALRRCALPLRSCGVPALDR